MGGVFSGTDYSRTVDNSALNFCGGTSWDKGAQLQLFGKNWEDPGAFVLYATSDANTRSMLYGKPNGTLTWNGKNLAMQEDVVPRSGGEVMTGNRISRVDNTWELCIDGGRFYGDGATLTLFGKNTKNLGQEGNFWLTANNTTTERTLIGTPNGTLTWGTKNVAMQEDVIPRSGGAVMTGYNFGRNVDNNEFRLHGGTDYSHGASVVLYGKDCSWGYGRMFLHPSDGTNERALNVEPNGTFTWDGTAIQYISDQRYKQQIDQIDDKLLDAWEDVELSQFKYNDAVDQKGDTARLHTGYIVQQIDSACKSHGVDVSEYGLYCHEEYPEETEEVEVTQEDGTKTKEKKVIREASEHYSLRYTETLVVECAYLRRENKKLNDRLTALEELFKQYITK